MGEQHGGFEQESSEREGEESEKGNPVSVGLGYGEYAHLGTEAWREGATEGKTWAGLGKEMGHEFSTVFQGGEEVTGADQAWSLGASPIGAGLGIIGGGLELNEGRERLARQNSW